MKGSSIKYLKFKKGSITMKARKIRPFLPSIDFNDSKSFYQDMGFSITYEEDKLVILSKDDISFFLQDAYVKDWAENIMIQLFVDDLEILYGTLVSLKKKYNSIKLKPIFNAHYGKTFHLLGPAGELWHMMESK